MNNIFAPPAASTHIKKLILEVVLGLLVMAGLLYWYRFYNKPPTPDVSDKISEQTQVNTGSIPKTNPFDATTNPIPKYENPFK